jgi:hypothetical protein
MPDSIEGGDGRGHFDREISQQNLETLIILLLRDLASGDYPYRTIKQFFLFMALLRLIGSA